MDPKNRNSWLIHYRYHGKKFAIIFLFIFLFIFLLVLFGSSMNVLIEEKLINMQKSFLFPWLQTHIERFLSSSSCVFGQHEPTTFFQPNNSSCWQTGAITTNITNGHNPSGKFDPTVNPLTKQNCENKTEKCQPKWTKTHETLSQTASLNTGKSIKRKPERDVLTQWTTSSESFHSYTRTSIFYAMTQRRAERMKLPEGANPNGRILFLLGGMFLSVFVSSTWYACDTYNMGSS